MPKFCKSCKQFKGNVITCRHCGLAICSDCRIGYICKDCFLKKNGVELIGEYYNEKENNIIIDC